jgi:gliding motility-associated-like protein
MKFFLFCCFSLFLFSCAFSQQCNSVCTLALVANHTNVTCKGVNNGAAVANVSGGTLPYTYLWSNGQTTSSISDLAPGTYTLTVHDASCVPSGNELVTNGSFSNGNTGVSSGYSYCNPISPCLSAAGTYAIDSANGSDHTTGTGSLMFINGDANANTNMWCQTINVVPGTNYLFSTWVSSWTNISPAVLQFSISGTPIGSLFNAPASTGVWSQFCESWNSGSNSSATICVVDQSTASNGNDPGLDDISFQPCVPCTITKTVTITEPPLLAIINSSSTKEFCNRSDGTCTLLASGGSGNYTYSWNTNPIQTSVTAIGLKGGSYKAIVTDSLGCLDSVIVNVNKNPRPVVALTADTSICKGHSLHLVANGANTYSWSPSTDLDTASGAMVITHPNATISYTVIGTDTSNCLDTALVTITVHALPTILISPVNASICSRSLITFTASVGSSYLWDFGDGSNTSNLQVPIHYYINSGTHHVTLVVKTSDSCSCTINDSVNVYDAPQSSFTFSNVCLIDSSQFINSSLDPPIGTVTSWSWDFGDGTPSDTAKWSPAHLYASPGNYPITLITHSSNLGCPDTLRDTINVFSMPTAEFGFANVCLHRIMNFNDSSSVSNSSVTIWSWDFDDSTPQDTTQNPNHAYDNFGTYNVSLISTTNNGCKDTVAKNVVVHPLPVAQYTTANVCDDSIVHFNNASHIVLTDTIQVWKWNFGDNTSISNSPSNTHLYSAPGSYSVKLLTVSQFGCRDSITKILVVNPNPVVNFNSDKIAGCEVLCINFQDSSHILTGHNTQWLWGFGDQGAVSSSQNSNHCYSNDSIFSPITFNISLKVTSDSGCVTSFIRNSYITVYPNPNAHFTAQPEVTTITDPVISITDTSTGADFWNWNFGDNETTSVHNPLLHAYADTGAYTITLITSTLYNCFDTTHQTIIIEPNFAFYIPNSFTPNDDGVNDTFTGRGVFIKSFQMSIFDRWGNLIFVSDDINKSWDGKAKHGNDVAQQDVYVYSMKLFKVDVIK